eukprot:jgi/Tetstr1/461449/TSEL_006558.t1
MPDREAVALADPEQAGGGRRAGGLLLMPRLEHRRCLRRPTGFASVSSQAVAKNAGAAAPPPDQKPAMDVVAGATARAASQATIHPIDTMKVRMQAGDMSAGGSGSSGGGKGSKGAGFAGKAVGGAAVATRLQQGLVEFRSLYKGVCGAASGAGIIIGTYFAFYSTAKQALRRNTDMTTGQIAFVSGSAAAVGSCAVKVPLAVCIRSVQAGVYDNVFQAASEIRRQAGVRGLFTGFSPTLLEDVPDMAVKFAVYESLRPLHAQLTGGRTPNTLEDLCMGGLAGVMSAAVTTPLDVIKTRMMCSASSRPTVHSAFLDVMKTNEGPRAFFRGLAPRCISNGLNSAIFFCFFETIRQFIGQRQARLDAQAAYDQSRAHSGKPPNSSVACLSLSVPIT